MTPTTKMRVPKIAELIADQIREQIGSRRLREGDRLPAEPALMSTFGASRPSVREALRILESDGLITVRRGVAGGAFVARPDHRRVAVRLRDAIRLWDIDPSEAAALIDGAELAAVRRLAEEVGPARIEPWPGVAVFDPRFHGHLVSWSGASVAHALIVALDEVVTSRCTDSRAHTRALRAIRRGDTRAAVEIWRSHQAGVTRSAGNALATGG
ncbi:MAG TPA: GntR family transcriptional regulator [Streptosporangiaceae bacterium]|nr:GntR family transcriptional regulator [Streptosporangiaceae bacterium]